MQKFIFSLFHQFCPENAYSSVIPLLLMSVKNWPAENLPSSIACSNHAWKTFSPLSSKEISKLVWTFVNGCWTCNFYDPVFITITWHVAAMSNQELVQVGRKQMDQTDQTIERSKKVCEILSSPPLHQLSSVLVWKGFGCLEWFAWDFLPLVQLLHELPWTIEQSIDLWVCLSRWWKIPSILVQRQH